MAKYKFSMKKGINVKRVVAKLATTLIVLYAGGYVIAEIGDVMNATTSPFNNGLTLIGWTVDTNGLITNTSSSGILTVIGIIGIASIVLEFVQFRL